MHGSPSLVFVEWLLVFDIALIHVADNEKVPECTLQVFVATEVYRLARGEDY